MTKQDLLKPRYKVISDYPESPFEINEVIDGNILVTAPIGLNEPKYASDFPQIFKELQWFEEREEKDLPKYVKVLKDIPYYGLKKGQIVEVTEVKKGISNDMNKYSITLSNKPLIDLSFFTPADVVEEKGEDRLNLKEINE